MSLPIPNLDDRNFEDLMKEALSLIPVYDKQWTNYNPSDPGITLLELFSWLSEMTIYRINRVPEENYRKFLELLGIKYLFKWNEIPGNDTDLIKFLAETYKVDWVKIAKVEKNDEDKVINIHFENNSILLKLGDKEDKVTIELDSGATHELDVKKELRVYESGITGGADGWVFRWDKIPGADKNRLINFLIRKDAKYFWLNDACLEKTDKGKTLRFFYKIQPDKIQHLTIGLNDEENKVALYEGITPGNPEKKYEFGVIKDLKIYETLESDIRRGLESVSKRYRAITSEDFEFLANECINALQEGLAGRVICVNNRDLEYGKTSSSSPQPGHVSVIIIPGAEKPEFSWDSIPGKDNIRLLGFLQNVYGADWIKSAKIEKSKDGSTVTISEVPNIETTSNSVIKSICLKMNQEKVNLESRFYASYEFNTDQRKSNVYCYTVNGKPSDLLKDQIKKYLDKRKLVTTRLHVVAPDYRKVTLSACISLKADTLKDKVIEEANESISKYFDSLEGGKDSSGWPIGRNLYKSEIYQLLEGVPGVDHVIRISIDDSGNESVELKYQLIELTAVKIEVCDE